VICAKFGKDLFNISKVIGRKKVAQFFLTHSVDVFYSSLSTLSGHMQGYCTAYSNTFEFHVYAVSSPINATSVY